MTNNISRRTVAKGAAWAVPAIAVASSAPVLAASPESFNPWDPKDPDHSCAARFIDSDGRYNDDGYQVYQPAGGNPMVVETTKIDDPIGRPGSKIDKVTELSPGQEVKFWVPSTTANCGDPYWKDTIVSNLAFQLSVPQLVEKGDHFERTGTCIGISGAGNWTLTKNSGDSLEVVGSTAGPLSGSTNDDPSKVDATFAYTRVEVSQSGTYFKINGEGTSTFTLTAHVNQQDIQTQYDVTQKFSITVGGDRPEGAYELPAGCMNKA